MEIRDSVMNPQSKPIVVSILTADKRVPSGLYWRDKDSNVMQPAIYFRKPKSVSREEYEKMLKMFKEMFYEPTN